MARLSNNRLRKRMEALHFDFETLGSIAGTKKFRGSDISHDELNNLEGEIAAIEAAFASESAITFTAPSRPGRYFGRTEKDAARFISGLESRFAALMDPSIFAVLAVTDNTGSSLGGVRIEITGVGFVKGATVTIGGEDATDVTFFSSSRLLVTTPALAAGDHDVVVTNPSTDDATLTDGYTTADLTVTAASPDTGPAAGGQVVELTGDNFSPGIAATVDFGTDAATDVVVLSESLIRCTTPAVAAAEVDVVVTQGAVSDTLTDGYTFE